MMILMKNYEKADSEVSNTASLDTRAHLYTTYMVCALCEEKSTRLEIGRVGRR